MQPGCRCIKRPRAKKERPGRCYRAANVLCASNVARPADDLNGVPRKLRETRQSARSATRSPGAITNVSAALPREMAIETFPYESS